MTSEPVATLAEGTRVGRFVIEQHVASGGMGSLYKARDPDLGRVVAIKLLRSDRRGDRNGAAPDERLLREARTLARLAHPHVVAVYDAGTFEGEVFIAMEFVEGVSLREWARAHDDVNAIVELLLEAGEGLAAAHAAGLVHRDFKPDNVLVGNDGRVRVVDFGLARDAGAFDPNAAWNEPNPTAHPSDPPPLTDAGDDVPLTREGALVGTPRYMAPEQLLGLGVDARSDQFSFAVTAYEALFRALPFDGKTRRELASNMTAGAASFPASPRVPRWFRAALERAMKPVPLDRFPSMSALLSSARSARRRRRRAVLGAFVGAAVLASSALGYGLRARPASLCSSAADPARAVWSPERRAAVEASFAATKLPYAEAGVRAVESSLDAFVRDWTSMRVESCEATLVHRTQSAELMDLRVRCLDEALDRVRARVGVLAKADADVVERATALLPAQGSLGGCADAVLLRSSARFRGDPALRARASAIRNDVASARVLLESGRPADALKAAQAAADAAVTTGDRPTEADAFLALGDALTQSSNFKGAEEALLRAARAAEAGRDDDVAARARIALVGVLERQARYADADARVEDAAAAVERLGGDAARAALDRATATVLADEGKLDAARESATRALAVLERLRGADDPDVADMLIALGNIDNQAGKLDEATASYQRATSVLERALGSDHPRVARAYMSLGSTLRQRGRYDESTAQYEHARAILERVYGPESERLGTVFVNLGTIARKRGDYTGARASYEHAEALWQKALGEAHPNVGTAELRIGTVLLDEKRPADAMLRFEHARAIWEKALGADNATVAAALTEIGRALLAEGKADDAVATEGRAIAMDEKALGSRHPDLVEPLSVLGAALLASGRAVDAVAPLERALSIRESKPADAIDLADTRSHLADALLKSGTDVTRAHALLAQARAAYLQAPDVR